MITSVTLHCVRNLSFIRSSSAFGGQTKFDDGRVYRDRSELAGIKPAKLFDPVKHAASGSLKKGKYKEDKKKMVSRRRSAALVACFRPCRSSNKAFFIFSRQSPEENPTDQIRDRKTDVLMNLRIVRTRCTIKDVNWQTLWYNFTRA